MIRSHFFSDPASLTHSQAQSLISLSRCLLLYLSLLFWESSDGLFKVVWTVVNPSLRSYGLTERSTNVAWFSFTLQWSNRAQTFTFSLRALCALSCCAGSSTACIVVLDRRSHRLHTCNLGDSGFLVVRGGEVVHRSSEQQHYFNTPFQLSIAPPGAEGAVLSDRWGAHGSAHLNLC